MRKDEVKEQVYNFVNEACHKLHFWIISMQSTNDFILMDAKTASCEKWTLAELESCLQSEEAGFLALMPAVKAEAVAHNYPYLEGQQLHL